MKTCPNDLSTIRLVVRMARDKCQPHAKRDNNKINKQQKSSSNNANGSLRISKQILNVPLAFAGLWHRFECVRLEFSVAEIWLELGGLDLWIYEFHVTMCLNHYLSPTYGNLRSIDFRYNIKLNTRVKVRHRIAHCVSWNGYWPCHCLMLSMSPIRPRTHEKWEITFLTVLLTVAPFANALGRPRYNHLVCESAS